MNEGMTNLGKIEVPASSGLLHRLGVSLLMHVLIAV